MTGRAHIVLLRHGQTDMSRAGLFVGSTDTPLNDCGRAAAKAWRPTFEGLDGVLGLYSPLARARETAALSGLSGSTELAALREWDLGDLEGQETDRVRRENPEWNLFADGPPNASGESTIEIVERAARVSQLIRRQSEQYEAVVLVGHGQFSRVLVTHLLGWNLMEARRLAWGPTRAAVLTWRSTVGSYVLAGWNREPTPWVNLTTGNQ